MVLYLYSIYRKIIHKKLIILVLLFEFVLFCFIMPSKPSVLLERFYTDRGPDHNADHNADHNVVELCIDEAGRGCLFGRVYIGCVVLPKDPELFSGIDIKDSKKFSSKTKIKSAFCMVESRWAMMMEVRFLVIVKIAF